MSSERPIRLSEPYVAGNEWAYVKECLDAAWLSSAGSFVDRFEREFAARLKVKAAVACSSGTAAIHVALLLSGVGPGDEVVVPALTFVAPANAVVYVGASPVFVDAEPRFLQLDTEELRRFLEDGCVMEHGVLRNRVTGRAVRAVLPVHVLGHPCDMRGVSDLAERFGLKVIEDASEALGSTYDGRAAGTLGDFGCFSFNGNKIVTTGSGGMLVLHDSELAARAKYLTTQAKDDPVEFVHGTVGFNYRLSNVSAAIGVAQLEQLDEYLRRKTAIAGRYEAALKDVPGLSVPAEAPRAKSNHWLNVVAVDGARFGMSSRSLMRSLERGGIETRPLWQPMHRSPAHARAFSMPCEVAEALNEQCLCLPSSVGLEEGDQERVIREILRCAR